MTPVAGKQTIFALSSGKLPAGVAVIRVSGPQTFMVLERVAGSLPTPRQAALRKLVASDGRVLDEALVLWFPSPNSFTGEDCAEFQCHGGPAVVAALSAEFGTVEGCRLAEAGEFSLRAFTNGKSDLTQMEALADLIDAETESQRALAITGASGSQKILYEGWRADLLKARAFLEADLDFSDEDDVPGSVADAANLIVADLIAQIQAHLKTYRAAEIIREGFRVVIAGAPNAGKSTLLNTLAKREVAIVTDVAGTTRDVIDVPLDLGGLKVVISDTAGLRETDDHVEQIGIERANAAMRSADLILMLSDDFPGQANSTVPVWLVKTKCDEGQRHDPRFDYYISCSTGFGIDTLITALTDAARDSLGNLHEGEIVTRGRHVALLENARDALARFEDAGNQGVEFSAEELRVAAEALGRITGVISTEDVLGAIFSSFCIGK
jgi:tRNA modification GTPase